MNDRSPSPSAAVPAAPPAPLPGDPPEPSGADTLMTPAEVAALFRVDPKTVTRWAVAGKLQSFRTLGGHRRYRSSEVHALLADARGERQGD